MFNIHDKLTSKYITQNCGPVYQRLPRRSLALLGAGVPVKGNKCREGGEVASTTSAATFGSTSVLLCLPGYSRVNNVTLTSKINYHKSIIKEKDKSPSCFKRQLSGEET